MGRERQIQTEAKQFFLCFLHKADSDPKQKKEVKKTAYNTQDLQPITT